MPMNDLTRAVLEVSRQHPDWGCRKIAEALKQAGWKTSKSSVDRILADSQGQAPIATTPRAIPPRPNPPPSPPPSTSDRNPSRTIVAPNSPNAYECSKCRDQYSQPCWHPETYICPKTINPHPANRPKEGWGAVIAPLPLPRHPPRPTGYYTCPNCGQQRANNMPCPCNGYR